MSGTRYSPLAALAASPARPRAYDVMPEALIPAGTTTVQNQSAEFPLDPISMSPLLGLAGVTQSEEDRMLMNALIWGGGFAGSAGPGRGRVRANPGGSRYNPEHGTPRTNTPESAEGRATGPEADLDAALPAVHSAEVAPYAGGVSQRAAGEGVGGQAAALPHASAARAALIDPEGRPITAPLVAGVRVPGGPNVRLLPEDVEGLSRLVAPREIVTPDPSLPRNVSGEYRVSRMAMGQGEDTWAQATMRLRDPLDYSVRAHEVGHGLQYSQPTALTVPPAVYGEAGRHLYIDRRLPRAKQNEEIYANAVEQYLTNPEWFKRQLPLTAAWLRSKINVDPVIMRHLQLNQPGPLAVLAGGGAAAGASQDGTQ